MWILISILVSPDAAGVGDGVDNAEGNDGSLKRYTIKDIIFLPEDHEVIPPTAAEVAAAAAAAAAKRTKSGRTIKRAMHHDELYDDNRSTKRKKKRKIDCFTFRFTLLLVKVKVKSKSRYYVLYCK